MKFSELQNGQWFVINNKNIRYIKIDPIEDRWGNCFIAVNDRGDALEAMDLSENCDIVPLDKEQYAMQ